MTDDGMKTTWRRSASVWPEQAQTYGDTDWTLMSDSGARLARIYNAGRDDGVEPGDWRWRVYRVNGLEIGGSAMSGTEARQIAARLVE